MLFLCSKTKTERNSKQQNLWPAL